MRKRNPHESRPSWMPEARISIVGALLALAIVSLPLLLL